MKKRLILVGAIAVFGLTSFLVSCSKDEDDKNSSNDFGKDIIPKMLADGKKLVAYNFEGYWKDVGTITSLWEANMDVLDAGSGMNLADRSWRIYARNFAEPPHYIGKGAIVDNSTIGEGSNIYGEVHHSVVSHGATIGKAFVYNSVVMPGAVIEDGAEVRHSIIGNNAVVGKGAKVGSDQSDNKKEEKDIAVIGEKAVIEANAVIKAGAMIEGGR